jgi:hypothetical protein
MSQPRISVTVPGPGARGRQRYRAVELQTNEHRCVLRYERTAAGLELAELQIEQDFDDPADREIEPVSTRLIAQLDRTAREALALMDPEPEDASRVRRELTPEFLRDVLRRHLEHGGSTEALAREEGVGTSTVRHWLRKAREAGIEA